MFKVLLVGHSGVGKSSLLFKYVDDVFPEDMGPTVGADFKEKCLDYEGKEIKLQVESFENLHEWVKEIVKYAGNDVVIIVVGNKCDQTEKRVVDIETAEKLAKRPLVVHYMEVSAKTGANVMELFEKAMTELLAVHSEDSEQLGRRMYALAPGNLKRQPQSACCSIL